ncbi:chitin binding peritrophin-A domain-containing protein [Nocardia transvalensis]|uniref:chitin binding peritrophin-A domain-containing protein n=1 Tax=Nocardia transvalensis TaxID=37333 RepID=UPI00226BBF22|nr:chitin binding peritrophin-A domain-containing protein [Nocardia transvalensis]
MRTISSLTVGAVAGCLIAAGAGTAAAVVADTGSTRTTPPGSDTNSPGVSETYCADTDFAYYPARLNNRTFVVCTERNKASLFQCRAWEIFDQSKQVCVYEDEALPSWESRHLVVQKTTYDKQTGKFGPLVARYTKVNDPEDRSADEPISGTFVVFSTPDGQRLCHATTDAQGQATCTPEQTVPGLDESKWRYLATISYLPDAGHEYRGRTESVLEEPATGK